LIEGGQTYHTVFWLRLWVIGFGAAFFIGAVNAGRLELALPRANWLIALFVLTLSVSLLLTHYYWISVYWYSNFLVYLLLGYLSLGIFSRKEGRRIILALYLLLILAGLIESTVIIVQYACVQGPWYQVGGTFFNPAYFAGYMGSLSALPLAGAVFRIFPEKNRRTEIGVRLLLGIIFAIFIIAVALSASRSIIFAAVPVGLVLLMRFRAKALAALAVLIIAVVIIPNPVNNRLKHLNRESYAWDRITIWKTSLNMIKHHPAGVGLGMYQYYYQRYSFPAREVKVGRYQTEATFAHNDYLNLSAEASPLACLFGLGWLAAVLLPVLFIFYKKGEPDGQFPLLLAFSGSLLAILVHALVDNPLRQPPIAVVAVADVAAIICLASNREPRLLRRASYQLSGGRFLKGFFAAAAVVMAALMSYQAAIYALNYRANLKANPGEEVNYLARLSRLPSGYAPLYMQEAMTCKLLFQQNHNPKYAECAQQNFLTATEINSENSDYFYQWSEFLYRLGMSLSNRQLLDQARGIALQSLERSDKYPYTYMMLANIARLEKDSGAEQKWLDRALDVEPYYYMARLLRSELLIDQGRLAEAKEEINILKNQKAETDAIQARESWRLKPFQLNLLQLPGPELKAVEDKLSGVK